MSFKAALKRHIQDSGWYVRKTAGLSVGVDLFQDLKKFGTRPKCVFDIGAHHGDVALSYANGFPGSSVVAFEPVESNFIQLKKYTADNSNIVAVNAAVGDQPGKLAVRLHPETSQGHSVVPVADDQTESVDAITIDGFCADRGFAPDFIKIDVEGYERRVIAGATQTLKKSPKALLVEATVNPANKRHTQLFDLIADLTPYGFRLVAIHDQSLWEDTGQLEFFNALFIKR
jgi:FkbM family methyltransferase